MTLDEAIKHAEEVAYQKDLESGFDTDNERYAMTDKERADCKECAAEHRQLAEWLKELKQLKEQEPCTDAISRQAAIDAIENTDWYHQNANGDMVSGANPDMHQAWYKADDVYSALKSAPSAQPEIIRCKDCKYNTYSKKCLQPDSFFLVPADDFYCGYAERRTDE